MSSLNPDNNQMILDILLKSIRDGEAREARAEQVRLEAEARAEQVRLEAEARAEASEARAEERFNGLEVKIENLQETVNDVLKEVIYIKRHNLKISLPGASEETISVMQEQIETVMDDEPVHTKIKTMYRELNIQADYNKKHRLPEKRGFRQISRGFKTFAVTSVLKQVLTPCQRLKIDHSLKTSFGKCWARFLDELLGYQTFGITPVELKPLCETYCYYYMNEMITNLMC